MLELNLEGLGAMKKKFTRVWIHPAAEFAPPLKGERFKRFCEMTQRIGRVNTIDPIVAVRWPEPDGHVNGSIALLNGLTLIEAYRKFGWEPEITLYDGAQSPAEVAARLNLFHNHPTTGQLAATGVEYEDQIAVAARDNQKTAGGDRKSLLSKLTKAIKTADATPAQLHARKIVADTLDISEGSIWQARKVRDINPALFEQLKKPKDDPKYLALPQAFSQVRRQEKRASLPAAATLPIVKPKSLAGGIRPGDSFKLMPLLPRRAISLVFADYVYNIGVDYGDGVKADKLTKAEYLLRVERWIKQLPELLTIDGCVWILINDEYAAHYVILLERAGLKMRNWITWYETFGVNCMEKFNRTSRHLLYFVKDESNCCFHPEIFSQVSARHYLYGDGRSKTPKKRMDDVWMDIPRLSGTCAEHLPEFPTQLPLALLKRIILGCTEPGDNVLDPFSGSGTTAVACKMTGRNGIGIEINPKFAALSQARWEAANAKGD